MILPEFSSRNEQTFLHLGLRAKRTGVALAQWAIKPGNDPILSLNRGWTKTSDCNSISQLDRATVKLQYFPVLMRARSTLLSAAEQRNRFLARVPEVGLHRQWSGDLHESA